MCDGAARRNGSEMTGKVTIIELMPRKGLQGAVVMLFPTRHTGIVHGDDEYGFAFGEDSLVGGFGYWESSLGLRVSHGIFFAAGVKISGTKNVGPTHEVTSLYPEERP
jgi:hypothetical protein